MSAAHAPGPWEVGGTVRPCVFIGSLRVFTGVVNDEESRANARLIAAAPDMLAALRRAALALAFAAESSKAMQDDYEAVSAAIAKATGQEGSPT